MCDIDYWSAFIGPLLTVPISRAHCHTEGQSQVLLSVQIHIVDIDWLILCSLEECPIMMTMANQDDSTQFNYMYLTEWQLSIGGSNCSIIDCVVLHLFRWWCALRIRRIDRHRKRALNDRRRLWLCGHVQVQSQRDSKHIMCLSFTYCHQGVGLGL